MKIFTLFLVITFGCVLLAKQDYLEITSVNQTEESLVANNPAPGSKFYFGGNVGFRFWNDYFYISAQPLVGYKINSKLSVGGKIGYTYINDSRIDPSFSSNNYGGSLFTRYRVVPQVYLHGEFAYTSFESITGFDMQNNKWTSERSWVPFLLLGGGYSQQIGPNVWAFAEILFDVLQDSNSPYEKWEPFVSFGVGVGF